MTSPDPSQKAIVLTGASGLLGSALSRGMAADGWHVIAVDLVEPRELPKGATFVRFDLTDIAAMSKLREKVMALTNNLKGLINNAAFNPKVEGGKAAFGKFEDLTLEEWEKEVRLNVTAPIFLTKTLLETFSHTDGRPCKIINVLSMYGIVPPNQDLYRELSRKTGVETVKPIGYPTTKAALGMVTRYLAVYLAKRGFNVNAFAPGGIENRPPREFLEAYARMVPMGRMARVEEMLGVVRLLSGEGSDYMNGQIIAVDGGWTVW